MNSNQEKIKELQAEQKRLKKALAEKTLELKALTIFLELAQEHGINDIESFAQSLKQKPKKK